MTDLTRGGPWARRAAGALVRWNPHGRAGGGEAGGTAVTEPGTDVLVLGGGPAGRALAGSCAAADLRTALVDPAPQRPWTATYCAWPEELPACLPASAVAARPQARVVLPGPDGVRRLGDYAVLDTAGLRAHLDAGLSGVAVLTGHAREVRRDGGRYRVRLDDRTVSAALVVDATGAPSRMRPAPGTRAEQTAYGVVVGEAVAAPVTGPDEAVFMDWRSPAAAPDWTDWPTFLYAVPYGDGTVLLEETSLARRPGLPLPELRARLHARLDALGVAVPDDAGVERVRFPVDTPRGPGHPVPFGAATPLVHPATGFSVAPALQLAPRLAAVLAAHLPADPDRATAAAGRLLWSPAARWVHRLRRHGLRTVLEMPPPLVPGFFDAFFAAGATAGRRHAFLTGRDDLPGNLAGMAGVFAAASGPVRWKMLRSAARFHPIGR